MDLARYLVDAVLLERRSYRDVAAAHGVSIGWMSKVMARYRAGGYEAIGSRSRAAHRVHNRTPVEVEDAVVRWRKVLDEQGLDAGAQTIHYHLSSAGEVAVLGRLRPRSRSARTPAFATTSSTRRVGSRCVTNPSFTTSVSAWITEANA
jgi:hypothetical protein